MRFLDKTWPFIILALLLTVPYFFFLGYFSGFNDDVIYLRDGGPGWMLNPEDKRVVNEFPSDFPATYYKTFELGSDPVSGNLVITAACSHGLEVNSTVLATQEDTLKLNWKRPVEYDITPYLKKGGNVISIPVRSEYSITALKTSGEVVAKDGSRQSLDSGNGWMVRSEKAFPRHGYNRTPKQPEMVTHLSFSQKYASGKYWKGGVYLFAASGVLVVLMIAVPALPKKLDSLAEKALPALFGEKARTFLFQAAVAAVFITLAVVLFHNLENYAARRGGDYNGHVQYLNRVLDTWEVPTARDGHQMYNPPVFYFSTAALYSVIGSVKDARALEFSGQLINTLATLLGMVVIYLILRRLFKDRLVVVAALSVAAFLPVSIYKAPSISGDSLFTLFCSVVYYIWLRYLDRPSRRTLLLLGLAVGVGFLTRYTAVMVIFGILAGFAHLYIRKLSRPTEVMRDAATFGVTALVLSGWYYLRNIMLFGMLFPINGTREFFFYKQTPGYRDWNFYTDPLALLINNPLSKQNIYESFLAAAYSTFWHDGQHLFVSGGSVDVPEVMTLMALALMPTVLLLWGMASAIRKAFTDPSRSSAFYSSAIAAVTAAVAAFVLVTFNYPFYSITKAHYLLNTLPLIAVFLGLGFGSLFERSGRFLAVVWTGVLCGLIVNQFYL